MGKQAGRKRQDAQALFRRGAGMHKAGRLAPAVAAYRSAVLLTPDHADVLNSLAAALAAMGPDAVGRMRQRVPPSAGAIL